MARESGLRRARPVIKSEWREHPDGAIVPRLSPFFLSKLRSDEPLGEQLKPKGENGMITKFEGGVIGKLTFDSRYPGVGESFLERGFGDQVPHFGHLQNGPRITLLSIEIQGMDMESALSRKSVKLSDQERAGLWFRLGTLEGKFHKKGIRVHIGSDEGQLRNYILDKGDVLQFIDVDARCTAFDKELPDAKRIEHMSSRLNWIGASMGENDFDSFVRGYVTGLFGKTADLNKRVGETKTSLKEAWQGSAKWLQEFYSQMGLLF